MIWVEIKSRKDGPAEGIIIWALTFWSDFVFFLNALFVFVVRLLPSSGFPVEEVVLFISADNGVFESKKNFQNFENILGYS